MGEREALQRLVDAVTHADRDLSREEVAALIESARVLNVRTEDARYAALVEAVDALVGAWDNAGGRGGRPDLELAKAGIYQLMLDLIAARDALKGEG